MNFFKISAITLVLIVSGLIFYQNLSIKNYRKNEEKEKNKSERFLNLIKPTENQILDIRKYNEIDWDELIIQTPYTSICDFGINGYPKDKKSCDQIGDQSNFLLFLKNNNLVQDIKIRRGIMEPSFIGKRIKRKEAIFYIDQNKKITLFEPK